MKFAVVFAAVLIAVSAIPVDHDEKNAQTLRHDNNNIGVDGYKYGYETSNGIKHDEEGHVINAGTDHAAIAVRGTISYVVDGQTYTLNYVADENGFQPEGAHLPKA